jgi:hypothetical protein
MKLQKSLTSMFNTAIRMFQRHKLINLKTQVHTSELCFSQM